MIKKPIVVSLGDPSGIGPEVFLKAIFETKLKDQLHLINLVCSKKALEKIANKLQYSDISLINIIDIDLVTDFILGQPDEKNASYVIKCLNRAADFAYKENLTLVTGPINKKIIRSQISDFSGHTEYLKKKFHSEDVLMLLANNLLKIGVATTHIPLKEVPQMITKDLIISKCRLLNQGLKDVYGLDKPKIAVLGLNPHSGENGEYGNEEIESIKPAIEDLKNEGLNLFGPISADSAFIDRKYDAYLSMYHDQALPVLKALDFHHSVNITLGLPINRFSVDHGTAEDIAPKFVADYTSMLEAIKLAGNDNIT